MINIFRPSQLVRSIENVVIGAASGVAQGAAIVARGATNKAREAKRSFTIEYGARRALALKNQLEEQYANLAQLSPEARAQYEVDLAEMLGRFQELDTQQRLRDIAKDAKRRAKYFR
jgi:hypothetical protein